MGTTSACAENTTYRRVRGCETRNYLRVRGEYSGTPGWGSAAEELPPRARRIPITHIIPAAPLGTTSACAENTRGQENQPRKCGNYLRVRGEYVGRERIHEVILELPPRARRIHGGVGLPQRFNGTTSACAENTDAKNLRDFNTRNYLRVRGEYLWIK